MEKPLRTIEFVSRNPDSFIKNGPVLEIEVSLPDTILKQMKNNGQSCPNSIKARALVDTGTAYSVVCDNIINELNAVSIGEEEICALSIKRRLKLYNLSFAILPGLIIELPKVFGAPFDDEEAKYYNCIIGRDFLSRVQFTYNGRTCQMLFGMYQD